MFYKNENYGGVLQAYALAEYLKQCGFFAEQICYDDYPTSFFYSIRKLLKQSIKVVACFLHLRKIPYNKTKRSIFNWAMSYVPHSKIVYNRKNIMKTNNVYDIFVAGSDQIWTDAYSDEYLLDFVNAVNKKVSYAASIGKKSVSERAREHFVNSLSSFSFISIREKESVELVKSITGFNIEWTMDPTLLLSRDEWDKVCSSRLITEKYIFCYYLGDDIRLREIARQFSERKGLKIVTIPYLQMQYNKSDNSFGNYTLNSASPSDFISLIKNAEYVLTDSFHACIFSNHYQKDYYVFDRISFPEMSIRIRDYLGLFNSLNHFIKEEHFNIDYIEALPSISYLLPQNSLNELIYKSKSFLNKIELL